MTRNALIFFVCVSCADSATAQFSEPFSASGGTSLPATGSAGACATWVNASNLDDAASCTLGGNAVLTVATGLPNSGGTITGQVVFSGAATDMSTALNESFTLAPSGTGDVVVVTDAATITFDGTVFDLASTTATNPFFKVRGTSTASAPLYRAYDSTNAQKSAFGYFGSTAEPDFQNKTVVYSLGGSPVIVGLETDVPGGTTTFEVMDNITGTGVQLFSVDGSGVAVARSTVKGTRFDTATNCSDSAGPAACGSASAGSVVIDAGSSSVVVSTTIVTANSEIFLQYDSSLGARLGVTCNTTPQMVFPTARVASTSFTASVASAPVTDPLCFSFKVVN